MKVTLIGMGSGAAGTWTGQAQEALLAADCLIGARRLLARLPAAGGRRHIFATKPKEILTALEQERERNARCAVVYSGDTGFYSGCRCLLPLLEHSGIQAEILPGVSSIQLLSAAIHRPWQDWHFASAHGVACDAVAAVMSGGPTFFLTGGASGPAQLCAQFVQAGLEALPVTVGENLGTPEQKVTALTAEQCAEREFAELSVLLAEAAPLGPQRTPGWPDSWFLRGKTPMTKQIVRAAALAKLAPEPGQTLWDIGAGTGSMSVEMAAAAKGGPVYAVECMPQAYGLLEQNRKKFCAWNVRPIAGRAPEVLNGLPRPDGVFIGGSKGHMEEIVAAVLSQNPHARLCISAIALESVSAAMQALQKNNVAPEAVQLAASEARPAGQLHLLTAQNPVFLITGNCDD